MRYNTYINNVKCKEWGLNSNQGAMFDLFNQLHSWADEIIIKNKVFYHISRKKIIEEIPLFYKRPDTVYRAFTQLHDKGLIDYVKQGHKDLIRLTSKGKKWNSDIVPNSEMNPNKLGNESVLNSDLNPTYNDTNNNITKIKERFVIFSDDVNSINKIESEPLPTEEVKKFLNYWCEAGPKDKKMRFEKQSTYNIRSRISTWRENFKEKGNGNEYYNSLNPQTVPIKMNLNNPKSA